MPKNYQDTNYKIIVWIFVILVILSLLAPLWVFKDLLFPYVTSKAFYFRILIELALPFYLFLAIAKPALRPKLKQPLSAIALVFLLINIVTTFTGVNPERSFWGNFERMGGVYYLIHLVLLYFYVLLIGQLEGNYLKRFLQMFLVASSFVALNGLFGKLGWGTIVPDPSLPGRVSSTLGNPIYVGSYLMIPMFVALFLAFEEQSLVWKIIYYCLALLHLVVIFLSGTRGALVGLIAGAFISAIFYLILTPQRRIKLYGFAVVGILVVAGGLIFANSNRLPQGSLVRRLFLLKDSNTEARLIQWGVALKGYKNFPIFGVGPENYYYIGNKYFNPAIYSYDRSWFDKPHNYILEILVTNGPLGLLAYLGLLGFGVWALWRAYRAGYFSLASFAVLFCALLAYQIQNLTVFDTVPASLTFYVFLGFTGYLWHATEQDKQTATNPKTFANSLPKNQPLAWTVAAVGTVIVIYAVYVTNILPAQAGKATNYGFAYASVDPQKASDYFQQAIDNPFNFDQTETASRMGTFATQFAQNASSADQKQLASQVLDKTINYTKQVLAENATYAGSWESLASDYMVQSYVSGQGLDPRAEDAVSKALELTPERLEAQQQMAQVRVLQNRLNDAEQILRKLAAEFPPNADLKAQLALVLHAEGKNAEAVSSFEQAAAQGFMPANFNQFKWLGDIYGQQGQYGKEVALYELIAKSSNSNIDLAIALVNAYVKAGQKDKALELYNKVIATDPSRAKDMAGIATTTGVKK